MWDYGDEGDVIPKSSQNDVDVSPRIWALDTTVPDPLQDFHCPDGTRLSNHDPDMLTSSLHFDVSQEEETKDKCFIPRDEKRFGRCGLESFGRSVDPA